MAQRMKARAKTVQRMTRDGLVQENLSSNSSVRLSRREADHRMERKKHLGKEKKVSANRRPGQTRDAPVRRNYKLRKQRIRSSADSVYERSELSVSLKGGEAEGELPAKESGRAVRGGASAKSKRAVKRTASAIDLRGENNADEGRVIYGQSGSGSKLRQRKKATYQKQKRITTEAADKSAVSEIPDGRRSSMRSSRDVPPNEKGRSNPSSKLYQKKHAVADRRGDSRKTENGGAVKPQSKKRLRFSYEETGAADAGKTEKEAEKKRRNSREQSERYQNTDYFNLREEKQTARNQKLAFEAERKGTASELKTHSRKEKIYREEAAGKKASKLLHGDPEAGKRSVISGVAGAVVVSAKQKIRKENDGNASVQGALAVSDGAGAGKRLADRSVRIRNQNRKRKAARTERKADRIEIKARYQEALQKDAKLRDSSLLKKQIQKARIKREYAKAKRAEQITQGAPVGTVEFIKKVGGKVTNFFVENRKMYVSVGVLIGMMMLIMASFTSCSVMFLNNVVDYSGYSYMSTDQAIRDADLYYTQLEAELQEKVNRMENENGGYDNYRYNIGMIGHDPFVLMSYLHAKYGEFTFNNTIKAELRSLFEAQYQISTTSSNETITETRTVRVGESLGPVVTSAYCACSICCGQWAGSPTASGVYPTANHTLAVDASNPIVPMGTKVVMNGVEYKVEDTGNFAQYGVAFDVYYDDHNAALNHGHQTWEAYLSDANGSQEIEVTTTTQQSVFSVTLASGSLSVICQSRLDDEQKEWYDGYNHVKGNLQMFETPLDYNWYYMVSSYYGYRIHPITGENQLHNGMDIAAPEGTPVMAGLTGRVTSASYNDSYGNYVILEDSDGYEIRYAHLNSISVSAGAQIEKGEEIGTVGSTGNSTGNHLHLELLHNGERLNPIFYFEAGEGSLFGGDVEYSSEAARRLCEYAVQFLGTPYVWGGYSPSGFDCSGFVSYCLTNSGALNIGHATTWGLIAAMHRVPESEMMPGDIIFFQGTYSAEPPTHVGIYLGNGQMVHSGHPNQITSIYDAYWQQHWYCVGRW